MGEKSEADESAKQWTRADGRPLKPVELKIYARAGLTPEAALEWADAGFEPYQTEQLREAGADLETAQRLRELGLTRRHLLYAKEHGESLETAGAAQAVGFDTALLVKARDLGLDDATITILGSPGVIREAIRLRQRDVAPQRILAWRTAGLDLKECRQELAEGTAEEAVEEMIAWYRAFKQPAVCRAWRATGLDPVAAKAASAHRYQPLDVIEGRLSDGPAFSLPRQEVIVSDFSPEPRLVDGGPLPAQVRRALGSADPAPTLRAFGYAVVRDTALTRFAGVHAEEILIGFDTSRGPGLAAIVSSGTEARLSVLAPNQDTPVATDHPSADEAVSALAAAATSKPLTVKSIFCMSLDAAELLRLAQPLAPHLDERATINKLGVFADEFDDAWWILPTSPARWPRHYVSDDGEIEAVGTLYLTTTPRFLPVGWFDNHADGVAATRNRVPLLLVERTDRSQKTTTTVLLSGADGLVVIDDLGRHRRLNTDDALTAISQVGSLNDVRANEATAFFISSRGPTTEQLVPLLRLRQPELLATEESVEFPDNGETDDWSDRTVDDCVSHRAVLINRTRWLAVLPLQGIRPRLLPLAANDEWWVRPAFREEWSSFSCIEESSMVSGTSTWMLAILDDDLIGEWSWFDEGDPYLTLRPRLRRQEDEVVAWIQSVSNELNGLDLAMFAVETLIGDLGGHQVPANRFDDHASDTLMCDLWIDGECEELLRALRRHGRGDAIDAIRKPNSQAAARRAQRKLGLDD